MGAIRRASGALRVEALIDIIESFNVLIKEMQSLCLDIKVGERSRVVDEDLQKPDILVASA